MVNEDKEMEDEGKVKGEFDYVKDMNYSLGVLVRGFMLFHCVNCLLNFGYVCIGCNSLK